MGKKKGSRKGKKAWRSNISMEDVEDFYDKSTKDALSGAGEDLALAPSDSLFFVDKSRDLSAKRKIEKHREKVLRCDSMLQRNSFVKPVPSSTHKKSQKPQKKKQNDKDIPLDCAKTDGAQGSGMVDIWEDEGKQDAKHKKPSKPIVIPAVEVDPPGCSYNPSFESHQDSLAHAVADEMQKIYRRELAPEPVPLTVPGEPIGEEEMLFLDADNGSDGDDEPNDDLGEKVDADSEKRSSTIERITRVQLNKRARQKERLKMEAEAKKVKELSEQIDSLPDITQEIAKEDENKAKRRLRRNIAKQERLKSGPPRLGRRKFQSAPVQVLLSEEISGSLRKLKACCTLARDRYKSLEKRGLVVPTVKSSRK